jgi:hypothetical protein
MNMDRPVWIVLLEVLAFADSTPGEGQLGFVNAVLLANDSISAEQRIASMLHDYDWEIIGIAETAPFDPKNEYNEYDDGVMRMVQQLSAHPDRILLSELSSHKPAISCHRPEIACHKPELAAIY